MLSAWVAVSAAGAQAVDLPNTPSCSTCIVRLDRVATLGSPDEIYVRSEPIWMSRDSRGRIYVTWQNYGHGPELAAVFDSTGKFLQEIGRKGRGPGEFHYPVTVNVGRNDRLFIWDFEGSRESVFDSSYRFIRQYVQRAATLVVLPDGRRVTNMSALDRDNVAAPIAIVDTLGAVVTALGATHVPYMDSEAWRSNRMMALGQRPNTLWAARPDHYRIEQWTLAGNLIRLFTRSPEWFPPINTRAGGFYADQPTPVVRAVREDAKGHLWLMVAVHSNNWRSFLGEPRRISGRRTTYPKLDRVQIYDTYFDVIDVSTGRFLATRRVPGMMQFFLADDLVASYRQADDGTPYIDIWRIRLTGAI